jgi:uncharacterized protein YecE (DUF72 family)
MNENLHIGLSGWSYDVWKDNFYKGVAKKNWLSQYASVFDAVEINATFYGQQRESTLKKWKNTVPGGFRFVIKANRYVTHTKRLKVGEDSIVKARNQCDPLGAKAAAVLWQFPANFRKDLKRLENFAGMLRKRFRRLPHYLEFRHTSWFDDETAGLMDGYGLCNVISDAADWPLWDRVTGDTAYMRLHGHTHTYHSRYSDELLGEYAKKTRNRLDRGLAVHVYFDNTDAGNAPEDARRFREMLK